MPKRHGFSLIETVIAIFVFALAMVMLSGVFTNLLKNYSESKKVQKNVENAQYAINTMAKTLRTSGVVATNSFPFQVFDYSQGKCMQYNYNSTSKKIQIATTTDSDPASLDDCSWGTIGSSSYSDLVNNITGVSVNAISTISPDLGRVTISLKVQDGMSEIPIQTSVSLRQ